jgi:hypothetical protein
MESAMPTTTHEAVRWLASRGAHQWLIRHHELVVEAAERLVDGLRALRVPFDADHVLLGSALHDAGKIEHAQEMSAPGHAHERGGEEMLLAAGFTPHLARACVTHARWSDARAALEDRLIALADRLWKGKRDAELEGALVEELAERLGRPSWEIFDRFDSLCQDVAHDAPARLRRSVA